MIGKNSWYGAFVVNQHISCGIATLVRFQIHDREERWTFFISLLKDLGKALLLTWLHWFFFKRSWCRLSHLFDTEEVFAEALNGIFTSLEGLNFGNMSEFAPSPTIFIVLNMLVRVDNLDHFFFRFVIKQVVLYCGTSLDRVEVRQREGFTEIVFLLAIIWA